MNARKQKEQPEPDKDHIIAELTKSLNGMMESYRLTIKAIPQENLANGVVKGYFHGEIDNAQKWLNVVKTLKMHGKL